MLGRLERTSQGSACSAQCQPIYSDKDTIFLNLNSSISKRDRGAKFGNFLGLQQYVALEVAVSSHLSNLGSNTSPAKDGNARGMQSGFKIF